ncbi:Molybdopterin biosynthesis MoaE [Tuber borchii]|uniref:Molybdopterin synthase catalytic subunit n=1 Tax=Tuber borchii TaxID=42251 RepID=A0A2T6ZLS2_TUBBO|nr:Molybdopterin biosynthesis MoaE [Tuber borchii]
MSEQAHEEREAENGQVPQQQQDQQLDFLSRENIHVELTSAPLCITKVMNRIRSPKAGALVLFAGTTRDTFDDKPVAHLSYTAYTSRALATMMSISEEILLKHGLLAICIVHRVGEVPIGEESVLIAVAGKHRREAWHGGEEALERVKERVEVWKMERFVDGEGVWRSNRDGGVGVAVDGGGDEDGGDGGVKGGVEVKVD